MGSTGSLAELTTLVKNIYEKLSSLSGNAVYIDHVFYPKVLVKDTQRKLDFPRTVDFIMIKANDCDVFVNFDREITSSEKTVIYANTFRIIARRTKRLYLQTPSGLSGTVSIEALILG